MSLFDQYETDAKKEQEGVEVPLLPNTDGSVPTFVLAATSKTNSKYTKALNKATKPYRRNMDAVSDEHAESIYQDVFVKHVLKSWRNVQERDGTVIEYNPANAVALFKRLPRLYDALIERANSLELFRDAEREGDAGN